MSSTLSKIPHSIIDILPWPMQLVPLSVLNVYDPSRVGVDYRNDLMKIFDQMNSGWLPRVNGELLLQPASIAPAEKT